MTDPELWIMIQFDSVVYLNRTAQSNSDLNPPTADRLFRTCRPDVWETCVETETEQHIIAKDDNYE